MKTQFALRPLLEATPYKCEECGAVYRSGDRVFTLRRCEMRQPTGVPTQGGAVWLEDFFCCHCYKTEGGGKLHPDHEEDDMKIKRPTTCAELSELLSRIHALEIAEQYGHFRGDASERAELRRTMLSAAILAMEILTADSAKCAKGETAADIAKDETATEGEDIQVVLVCNKADDSQAIYERGTLATYRPRPFRGTQLVRILGGHKIILSACNASLRKAGEWPLRFEQLDCIEWHEEPIFYERQETNDEE